MAKKRGGLVYSTDQGRICPDDRRSSEARPRPGATDGKITIARETKGRKGAGVTLVRDLPLADRDLKELAKQLKGACGVGGSVKSGVIELQGDQRDKAQLFLETLDYTVKRSGG